MRLTVGDAVVVETPGSDLHFHNVSKQECNRNQQQDNHSSEFEDLNSTQWASNFLTSQNSTLASTNGSNVNNNLESSLQQQNVRRPSFDASYDLLSESSPDDSLGDVDADAPQSSSSLDVSPQDDSQSLSHDDLSDSDSLSDDTNCTSDFTFGRGIVNPNYPGFQHLAHHLLLDVDEHNNNDDNNNNDGDELQALIENINHLGREDSAEKSFYDKPKIDIIDGLEEARCDSPVLTVLDLVNDLNVCADEETAQSADDANVTGASAEEENIATELLEEIAEKKEVEAVGEEIELQNTLETCEIVTEDENRVTEEAKFPGEVGCKTHTESEKEEDTLGTMFLDEDSFETVGAAAQDIKTNFLDAKTADHELTSSNDVYMNKNECKRVDSEISAMSVEESRAKKVDDAFFLKSIHEDLPGIDDVSKTCDLLRDIANMHHGDSNRVAEEREKFTKEEQTANEKEKDEDSVTPRKKEKMDMNYSMKKNRHSLFGEGVTSETTPMMNMAGGVVRRREFGPRSRESMMSNRRSMPNYEKKRSTPEMLGGFDVYNIETAMPKIDLDAIESHLRVAREEDRRRRNDREEIRKRLAMGSDADEYYGGERPGRKPSLQARLQSGMNLQICFMNETASDADSPGSDAEMLTSPVQVNASETAPLRSLPVKSPIATTGSGWTRPSASKLTLQLRHEPDLLTTMTEADFFARQARLQAEAHMALAQAKEMAHMQMEIERQRQKKSPITEMVRTSLEKVGIPFPEDRRRVSRQILTEMNVAQLQVIVNDLHTQIEVLNEGLVKFLMNRDDLHMEQDSMLVDIEDLTRYLGAKEQPAKSGDQPKDLVSPTKDSIVVLTNQPNLSRDAAMVRK